MEYTINTPNILHSAGRFDVSISISNIVNAPANPIGIRYFNTFIDKCHASCLTCSGERYD